MSSKMRQDEFLGLKTHKGHTVCKDHLGHCGEKERERENSPPSLPPPSRDWTPRISLLCLGDIKDLSRGKVL